MSKAIIVGAGPTSMYVAAALQDAEIEFDIYADKLSPPPSGRTWFGWVPPSIKSLVSQEPVYFFGLGSKADYMAKMGRPVESPSTFPEGKIEIAAGYNPKVVYDLLLDRVQAQGHLHIGEAMKYSDDEIREMSKCFDYVFVTFPTQASKEIQPRYVRYDNLVADNVAREPHPNMVVYNGERFSAWTRYIMMFGVASWEFSHLQFPDGNLPEPGEDTHWETTMDFGPGTVMLTMFDPCLRNVHLTGRWAMWNKAFRVDMAYQDTMDFLNSLR